MAEPTNTGLDAAPTAATEAEAVRGRHGILAAALALLFFAVALWLIERELRHYRYSEVVAALRGLGAVQILEAVGLTALNYVVLTGYDFLGLRYIRRPLPYHKSALAAFAGYAIGQALGFPLLTAAPIRYRLYSGWGLSAVEITQVVAFYSITFWLGYLLVAGFALVLHPPGVPLLHTRFLPTRLIGAIFLLLVALYVAWSVFGRRAVGRGEWTFDPPRPGLAAAQLGFAAVDWVVAAGVLFVLLPGGVSFPIFLSVFLAAQLAGVVSHVPGGLGVFEAVVLLLLPGQATNPGAVGALLAYRAIYYLLPLAGAIVALGVSELRRRREGVKRVVGVLRGGWDAIAPVLLAGAVFLGGAILLFSGATPPIVERFRELSHIVPLPLIELSHFLGSVVGAALLVLAWGLQRRLDAAYQLTVLLLAIGVVASLAKGLDYEEATALTIMLGVLVASRRSFYRPTSLTAETFDTEWIVAVCVVVGGSIWLGFFAYKHVAYSSELWWRFALHADAPRFLRATVGAVGALLIFAAMRLMRPARPEPAAPTPAALDRAEAAIERQPYTHAFLALLGDKRLLFGDRDAFLMYAVSGRSWVAMGDPVGDDELRADLAWRFRGLAHEHGGWPVFYQVQAQNLPLYIDLGLTLSKLGEEARVRLPDFTLEGGARKGLRYTLRKLEKEGCTIDVLRRGWSDDLLPELRRVSDDWIRHKHAREKAFSLGAFRDSYVRRLPVAVVRQGPTIVAFATLWLSGTRYEASVDLMRYSADAPPGVMDFLFLHLMQWSREEGFDWFNLGMAPLAGLESRPLAPFWNRVGSLVFRYGENFYGFQGLRQYKAKFGPVWEPKYLASPGGLALPAILANVATLISGGADGLHPGGGEKPPRTSAG